MESFARFHDPFKAPDIAHLQGVIAVQVDNICWNSHTSVPDLFRKDSWDWVLTETTGILGMVYIYNEI